jgi:hypothetical protein
MKEKELPSGTSSSKEEAGEIQSNSLIKVTANAGEIRAV